MTDEQLVQRAIKEDYEPEWVCPDGIVYNFAEYAFLDQKCKNIMAPIG